MVESIDALEVIFKTAERCNLNCSYCYFFHAADDSYKKHPPLVKRDTVINLVDFLIQGARELGLKHVRIDFHGGEPTLQKKSDFDWMCSHIRENLSPFVGLQFSLQTNGTLIDAQWAELFSKHQVSIGVSLDGTEAVNDTFRLDHQGRGSYKNTVRGIQVLQTYAEQRKIPSLGLLSVINVDTSPEEIYHHFVHELKQNRIDFLLPDFTHDTFDGKDPIVYAHYLIRIFKEWIKDDNPDIHIRLLNSIASSLSGGPSYLMDFGSIKFTQELITFSSNGDLSPDDTLCSYVPHFRNLGNVRDTSLKNLLNNKKILLIREARKNSPSVCKTCCWENICGGGTRLVHRFSAKNGFDNPSVYCSGLKKLYASITQYLIQNGISQQRIEQVLIPQYTLAGV
jgi:uncharacterized protein